MEIYVFILEGISLSLFACTVYYQVHCVLNRGTFLEGRLDCAGLYSCGCVCAYVCIREQMAAEQVVKYAGAALIPKSLLVSVWMTVWEGSRTPTPLCWSYVAICFRTQGFRVFWYFYLKVITELLRTHNTHKIHKYTTQWSTCVFCVRNMVSGHACLSRTVCLCGSVLTLIFSLHCTGAAVCGGYEEERKGHG